MKHILITQDEHHNKFWIGEVKGTQLITKWGRIGTNGQNKTYNCGTNSAAHDSLETKYRQKTNKGYIDADETKLKELAIVASIIGTANKMQYRWVEIVGKKVKEVTPSRLQQPDCEPALLIEMQSRKLGDIKMAISNKGSIEYPTGIQIDQHHKWWDLAEKAHEAIANV